MHRVFDTHCHLNLMVRGAEEMLRNAISRNVLGITVVGVDAQSSADAKTFCEKHHPLVLKQLQQQRQQGGSSSLAHLNWSAGLHPKHAFKHATDFDRISQLAIDSVAAARSSASSSPSASPRCVAIGEFGLDFYRNDPATTDEKVQVSSLLKHFELAEETGLPLIIHGRSGPERDAYDLFYDLTCSHPTRNKSGAPRVGVMHCWSGTAEQALKMCRIPDQIWFLSFPCTITYERASELRRAARELPRDRIVVETDSPWLPPRQAPRGSKNDIANVHHALDAVIAQRQRAQQGAVPLDEAAIREQIWNNSCRLFSL